MVRGAFNTGHYKAAIKRDDERDYAREFLSPRRNERPNAKRDRAEISGKGWRPFFIF